MQRQQFVQSVEAGEQILGLRPYGDVLFEHLRTLKGAHFPIGHFDTLIIETTRGMTERAYGKERVHEIARLIDSINDTIAKGGSFLLPVFALGRMQELLAVFHDARRFGRLIDCPIYAGGLGIGLVRTFSTRSRARPRTCNSTCGSSRT